MGVIWILAAGTVIAVVAGAWLMIYNAVKTAQWHDKRTAARINEALAKDGTPLGISCRSCYYRKTCYQYITISQIIDIGGRITDSGHVFRAIRQCCRKFELDGTGDGEAAGRVEDEKRAAASLALEILKVETGKTARKPN